MDQIIRLIGKAAYLHRLEKYSDLLREAVDANTEPTTPEGIAVGACETLNRLLCKNPSILRSLVEAARAETPQKESDKAVAYIYALATCKEVAEDGR